MKSVTYVTPKIHLRLSQAIYRPRKRSQVIVGIKLKSLILAQIERWRHALHMQVERQHGELALWWRVANG